MKSIFTLLIALFGFGLLSHGQKVEYDQNSGWYLGFNMGGAWHTTDVENKTKLGFGFTLGKSFLMQYGRPISFDVRARYLRGYWVGADSDTTNQLGTSGPVFNQYNSLGYYKQNFQSEQHRIALELVLHANNLRERTGWDPYIFAGIGFTGHQTYGDLVTYDDNFLATDYAPNENIDFVFETPIASGPTSTYSDKKFNWDVMPSLGVGLGYFVGPKVTVGLEHKTTFTLNDYYDGTIYNQDGVNKGNNDLYHYTNGYIRFYLGDGKKKEVTEERPIDPDPVIDPVVQNPNPVTPAETTPHPPVVTYSNPAASPHTSTISTFNLSARVQHVAGKDNITFRQNGAVNPNFSYNASSDQFTSNVELTAGQNVFVITGTNQDGTDSETMLINFEREKITPPVVNITNPSSNPLTVTNQNFNFTANVLNVLGQNQIVYTVNGNNSPFNYNTNTSGLTSTLSLVPGANTVTVTATNEAGTDSQSTTIIYRPGSTQQPPVVDFTNPNVSPYVSNTESFNLSATILNISSANQVTFKQNGVINSNFNYNAINNIFGSNIILTPGQNVFELIGTNNAGIDKETIIISYNRPAPKPPIVTITYPVANPFITNNSSVNLSATVLNVSSANQIAMNVNGVNTNNFSYNTQTNVLNTSLNLNAGSNVVTITGTNADGTDSKQTAIIYRPATTVQPPVVNFIVPNANPFNTTNSTETISASILNVTSSNQINVNLNGQNVTNFSFNTATHTLTATFNLVQGANILTITGTNTAGVDSETQSIILRQPQNQNPPIVTFVNPIANPTTVYNASYSVQTRVQNVANRSGITLLINGIASTNFSYSASSQMMNFSTGLINGANIIQVTATNNFGQDSESTTIIYRKQEMAKPPVVNITSPLASSYTINQPNYTIKATVQNVNSANEIIMQINGATVSGFLYNSISHQLTYNGTFNEGTNTIKITATNTAGTDNDNAYIIYKPAEVVKPPYVSFLNPGSNGTTVEFPGFAMKAQVLHVDTKSGVQVKFNGQIVNPTLYTFNATTREVVYPASLTVGNNIFQVKGTNSTGNHSATTTVIYKIKTVEPDCAGPTAVIYNPTTNGTTVDSPNFNYKAKVQNITASSQVKLFLNGVSQPFTFSTATKLVTKGLVLAEGNNVIELRLATRCGSKKVSKTIIYKPAEAPCEKPVVNPVTPNTVLSTDVNSIVVKANFENITTKNQIQFKVNGVDYAFNYDNAAHTLTANVTLKNGANTIQVTATNDCGVAKTVWQVTKTVCSDPVLKVGISPVVTGVYVNPKIKISGPILNIANSSEITVTWNGANVNFTYDAASQSFLLSQNLNVGENLFVITATNACGTATKKFRLIHKPVAIVKKPTVVWKKPTTSPYTTEVNTYTLTANTTNITSNSQINVTLNGNNTNFTFNASTKTVTLNQALVEGNNVFVITVVNQGGSDSKTTTIIHTIPDAVNPPVITVAKPTTNPHISLTDGRVSMAGTITNISNASQVQILFNGEPFVGYAPVINNDIFTFNFYVPVTTNTPSTTVQIIATNEGGTDATSNVIKKKTASGETTTGGGTITIGGGITGGGSGNTGGNRAPVKPNKPGTSTKRPVKIGG